VLRWLPLVAAAGCYSPSYTSCAVTCATSQGCPSGLDCVSGVCVGAGDSCGTGSDDAAPDTLRPDGGLGPWGAPVQITFANFPQGISIDDPTLRADMLEMLINVGGADIYRSVRPSVTDAWGMPTLVSELDTNTNIGGPDLSADGLQLVYTDDAGGNANLQITTRGATSGASATFTPPTVLTNVNSAVADGSPTFSLDTLTLLFHSNRNGNDDLFVSKRASIVSSSAWSPPVPLTSVNDVAIDDSPYLSADGLTLYFASLRTGAMMRDLYMATRSDTSKDFTNITPITELNTANSESDPWVSADGHHMYFARSDASNVVSVWYSTR
jgi:hypothetical protein